MRRKGRQAKTRVVDRACVGGEENEGDEGHGEEHEGALEAFVTLDVRRPMQ